MTVTVNPRRGVTVLIERPADRREVIWDDQVSMEQAGWFVRHDDNLSGSEWDEGGHDLASILRILREIGGDEAARAAVIERQEEAAQLIQGAAEVHCMPGYVDLEWSRALAERAAELRDEIVRASASAAPR